MAIFENKRKPVDIYADGTATVDAQNKTSDIASMARDKIAGVAKVALSGVTAPVVNAMGVANDIAENTIVPAGRALLAGRENQVRSLAGNELNANRTPAGDRAAMGLTLGQNFERKVGSVGMPKNESGVAMAATSPTEPMQQPLAAGLQRDGIQSQRIDPATQESFKKSLGQPVSTAAWAMEQNANGPAMTTEYGQGPNGTFTKRQVPIVQRPETQQSTPRSQLGLPQNKFNVGNMEVAFDPSVSQNARNAFLTDPVRPTAQIDRYNASNGAGSDQGMLASQNASRILGRSRPQGPPEAISPNGPNRTWGEAAATDKQVIENSAARRDFFNGIESSQKDRALANSEQQTRQLAENAKMTEQTARQRMGLDDKNITGQLANQAEQNRINKKNIDSQAAERAVETQSKGMDVEKKKRVDSLYEKLDGAKTPEEKAGIEKSLERLGALKREQPTVHFAKTYDSSGMVSGEEPYIFDKTTGEVKKAGGQQQQHDFNNPSQETLSYLTNLKKTNPKEFDRLMIEHRGMAK